MMTLIFKLEMSNSEAETLNKSKIHVDIVLLLKKGLNIIFAHTYQLIGLLITLYILTSVFVKIG